MRADARILAAALAAGLVWAGCGKPQGQSPPLAGELAVPAAREAEPPALPAEPAAAAVTDETPPGAAEFVQKSLASPFAQAGQALKEGYDAALIAFQVGDYARAASELRLLAKTPGLTPDQERAVGELLAQTLQAAPELASVAPPSQGSPAVSAAADPSAATAANGARPGGAEFTRKSLASPFAEVGQALKESYDSALVAVQIGDYARAVSELKVLAENPDLTPEQMQAVRDLMTETVKPDPSPGAGTAETAKPETPR